MTTRPVTVSWQALTETPDVLGDALQDAFGPDALGLLIVSGLPTEYARLREQVRCFNRPRADPSGSREAVRVRAAARGRA